MKMSYLYPTKESLLKSLRRPTHRDSLYRLPDGREFRGDWLLAHVFCFPDEELSGVTLIQSGTPTHLPEP